MRTYFEGLKAKYKLRKNVRGSFLVVLRLDSVTAIRLQQVVESAPNEVLNLKSVLKYPLSWKRAMIRDDLRVYANNSTAINQIIKAATRSDEDELFAGRVMMWVRHNFPDRNTVFYSKVIEVASQWKNPLPYMALMFNELGDIGLAEVLDHFPDSTERIIEVINSSDNYGGYINLPYGLLVGMANLPDHLQPA